jgi:exonuclease III
MRIIIWNVRGLGDDDKNETIHKTLDEAKADLICLQETKLIDISLFKARNFLHVRFIVLVYQPSDSASAGLLIAWSPKKYNVVLIDSRNNALTVKVESISDDAEFVLTNVYAPCDQAERSMFFSEIKQLQLAVQCPWVLAGDYNIYRYVSEKNNNNINWVAMDEFNT